MGHQDLTRVGLGAALALGLISGCTGGDTDNRRAPSPDPSVTPTVSAEAFARDDYVWRGLNGGREGLYTLDQSVGAGAYTVQLVCVGGGSMRVWQKGGPKSTVPCDGTVHDVAVCNKERKQSLTTVEWAKGPKIDWSWQFLKRGDVCKPADTGKA